MCVFIFVSVCLWVWLYRYGSVKLKGVVLCVCCVQYVNDVKQHAAFICFSIGSFSKAEVLLLESGCDPREVGVAICGVVCTCVLLM